MKHRIYTRNRPWMSICVIPVRYEHHLHMKQQRYPRNRMWMPIGVSCEVQATFTHEKSKVIHVTVRGGP
jgi:hypothetical protein